MGANWRARISTIESGHSGFEAEMRGRMRTKREEALKVVQVREAEIHERNHRRKIESMYTRTVTSNEPQSRYYQEL